MNIWLASGNKHKQQELTAIFGGDLRSTSARSQSERDTIKLPAEAGITGFDPEETGTSFAENALIKARVLYNLLGSDFLAENPGPILADDSGLCVDALEGKPGIYSARYYGKDSWASDGKFWEKSVPAKLTDEQRNLLLLEELDNISSMEIVKQSPSARGRRNCRFVCAMVLFFSPEHFYLIQETLEGEIVPSAAEIRGRGGFGYDPIVYLPELGRTVAELSEEEKNQLSHRGKAGRTIAKLLH